jgi:lipooligosaccharide transport system permease protein
VAERVLWRVVEREAHVYRRLWHGSVFSSFLIPVLFLAAIGVGLGGLVDQRSRTVAGVSYLHFVTPGILAAMAMQLAASGALWPIMAGTKWLRFFHGVVATPVRARDVYGGYVIWSAIRSAMSAAAFLIVAALLGGIPSWWGVLALPATVLTATAFTAPLVAFAGTQDTDLSFSIIIRLVIMPMFLFSGTLFPISQLPGWLRPPVRLSPLWHGAELCRAATTGHISWSAVIVHTAVLVAIIASSWWWGARTFTRKLTP